jgi:NosR/NirI family nitrous oxide reductase transcriptional regulator
MTYRGYKILFTLILGFALIINGSFAIAAGSPVLVDLLNKGELGDFYAGAERLDILRDNENIVRAEAGGKTLGYLFINSDFVDSTGYSGKPIDVLVAIDTNGIIQNVKLLQHFEPIILAGIPESRIVTFVGHLTGLDLAELLQQKGRSRSVDAVSGATVTTRVIDDSVIRSAFKVARQLGLGAVGSSMQSVRKPAGTVNPEMTETQDWIGLVADQSVTRLNLDIAEVSDAFTQAGLLEAAAKAESGDNHERFIELYVAPVSVPSIGLSLLGKAEYANMQKNLKAGQQAILMMGRGLYSYKGSGYVRGGIFDRFEVIQADQVIRFLDFQNKRLRRIAAEGAPKFKEVDLFYLPDDIEFDVTNPWHVDLLIGRAIGPTSKSFVSFALDYQLPEKYLLAPVSEAAPATVNQDFDEALGDPLWKQLWLEKLPEVFILSLLLIVLTVAFFSQNWVAQRPRLLYWGRIVFLSITLFGLGFYANAQLSVVNIITVFSALVSGFSWTYFLMEPLIFILWGSVIISLLFWGRGAYCGWLCPFGALQELINKAAQALRVKQVVLPWGVHERLWAVKYVIFILLFGVSLHSLAWAEYLAEVEPFKTVIILKFMRDWPFVIFALVLILPGLFIERFYCRYLCPLGAALAIPARLRMFEWLKRYRDCGQPCHTCANQCMVGAIHPEGNINPNECLYCLHCQKLYHDDRICPVMIAGRKKRERRAKWAGGNSVSVDLPTVGKNSSTVTQPVPTDGGN